MKVNPLTVILVVILAVVMFWPQISENLGLQDIASSKSVAIGVNIHYNDGTTESLNLSSLSIFPLSVSFGDDPRPILAVDFQFWGTFTYKGTLQSITHSTKLDFDFDGDKTMDKQSHDSGSIAYLPQSGASFKLHEVQITAQEFENWAGPTETIYYSTVYGESTINIVFADGTTETLTTPEPITGSFTFKVITDTGTTSILSAYISSYPWHDVSPSK